MTISNHAHFPLTTPTGARALKIIFNIAISLSIDLLYRTQYVLDVTSESLLATLPQPVSEY